MGQETTRRIRIVLLHDQGLFRASLARLLAAEPGFEVIAECDTSADALKVLCEFPVEIILLDFDLRSCRDGDFIAEACEAGYPGRFLIVAAEADARTAALALRSGASGIFLKSEGPDRLVRAIKLVANGDAWVDPTVIHLLADQWIEQHPRHEDLEAPGVAVRALEGRERDVLQGILGGLTNKTIGANIGLSESSVKNTVQRLFGKAGVKRRSQLVRVALEGAWGAERKFTKRMVLDTAMSNLPEPGQTILAELAVAQSKE